MAKFSDDLELEASYILNGNDCTCPAGMHRKYCRHKEMKDIFTRQGKINSEWFYNYDTDKWHIFEELAQ
jgi:hypothetical protein